MGTAARYFIEDNQREETWFCECLVQYRKLVQRMLSREVNRKPDALDWSDDVIKEEAESFLMRTKVLCECIDFFIAFEHWDDAWNVLTELKKLEDLASDNSEEKKTSLVKDLYKNGLRFRRKKNGSNRVEFSNFVKGRDLRKKVRETLAREYEFGSPCVWKEGPLDPNIVVAVHWKVVEEPKPHRILVDKELKLYRADYTDVESKHMDYTLGGFLRSKRHYAKYITLESQLEIAHGTSNAFQERLGRKDSALSGPRGSIMGSTKKSSPVKVFAITKEGEENA